MTLPLVYLLYGKLDGCKLLVFSPVMLYPLRLNVLPMQYTMPLYTLKPVEHVVQSRNLKPSWS